MKNLFSYFSKDLKRELELKGEHVHTLTAKEAFALIDDELPFKCQLCFQTYETDGELKNHTCPKFGPLQFGSWKCGVCQQVFKRRHEIRDHVERHSGSFY